jgi:hypothetical protein
MQPTAEPEIAAENLRLASYVCPRPIAQPRGNMKRTNLFTIGDLIPTEQLRPASNRFN